ncbi:MAG: IclR family transcriptional regulator [Gammaproteobacteria bacterium]|uniref:IclR family transcriptional regulator n=1 Tax=Bradyrhizobium sp. TaxID=376 RepID=UPI003D12BCA3
MPTDHHETPRGVLPRAPHRVMQVLGTLAISPTGAPLSRLSQRLGAPKSSLLNLLRALEQAGYVECDDGLYRLGRASVQLGAMIIGGDPMLRTVRHLLRRLARECGETSMIGIIAQDDAHALYVESVESRNALSFAVPVGRPVPLYCTAIGRAYLAFQGERRIRAYLDRAALIAYTPHTTVRKAELRRILSEVHAAGFAETSSQMHEGIDGFAAPVFDASGRVCAMVAAGAPAERVEGRRAELRQRVREAGIEMSEVLGYRGPYPPRAPHGPAHGLTV